MDIPSLLWLVQIDLNQSQVYWSAPSFGEEKVHVSFLPLDDVEHQYDVGITVTSLLQPEMKQAYGYRQNLRNRAQA